jgi:bifunctional DNA-binding transcriptional regulator/antitoxin component of YhaV-PrlF toxin-antitoxin module
MPLVRVKNKYQVLIPKRVRNEVGGVEVGNVIEAILVQLPQSGQHAKSILKPVRSEHP